MFDPFGDFESAGYLRNIERLNDPEEVKVQEHLFFEANIEQALNHLAGIRGHIGYANFLQVHRILFAEFYPWAGHDRHALGAGRLVGKGERLQFEASELCQRTSPSSSSPAPTSKPSGSAARSSGSCCSATMPRK